MCVLPGLISGTRIAWLCEFPHCIHDSCTYRHRVPTCIGSSNFIIHPMPDININFIQKYHSAYMYIRTILLSVYNKGIMTELSARKNKGRKGISKARSKESCAASPTYSYLQSKIHHSAPHVVPSRTTSQTHCILSQAGSCKNAHSTLLPVCNNGCPATILKKRSSPSLLLSITSSEKRLVKTFPGRVGMFTLVDSCSRISRKASKSE